MAHTMRAILLAKATAASLRGLRLSKLRSHCEGAGRPVGRLPAGVTRGLACWMTAVAPQHQQLSQPLVAGPAAVAQALPARGRAFARTQAQPGCGRPPRCEL